MHTSKVRASTTYTEAQVGDVVCRSNGGSHMRDVLPPLSAGSITVYNADATGLLEIRGTLDAPFVLLGPKQAAT